MNKKTFKTTLLLLGFKEHDHAFRYTGSNVCAYFLEYIRVFRVYRECNHPQYKHLPIGSSDINTIYKENKHDYAQHVEINYTQAIREFKKAIKATTKNEA